MEHQNNGMDAELQEFSVARTRPHPTFARLVAKNLILYVTQEDAKRVVEVKLGAVADLSEDKCWRMPIVPGLNYGGDRVRVSHRGNSFSWTHFVLFAKTGTFLFQQNANSEYVIHPDWHRSQVDLSHMCHVGDCCNPAHLIFEPSPINAQRNMCKWSGKCLGLGHSQNPCIFTEDSLENYRGFCSQINPIPVPGDYRIPRQKPNATKRKWKISEDDEEWVPKKKFKQNDPPAAAESVPIP